MQDNSLQTPTCQLPTSSDCKQAHFDADTPPTCHTLAPRCAQFAANMHSDCPASSQHSVSICAPHSRVSAAPSSLPKMPRLPSKELCPALQWVPPPASPACAPRAVRIALRPAGKLQVDHPVALGHIQASGSHIADQQRPVLPTAKLGQLALALPLTHLAMQAAHRHVVGTQLELGILQRVHHKLGVGRDRQACVALVQISPCHALGVA